MRYFYFCIFAFIFISCHKKNDAAKKLYENLSREILSEKQKILADSVGFYSSLIPFEDIGKLKYIKYLYITEDSLNKMFSFKKKEGFNNSFYRISFNVPLLDNNGSLDIILIKEFNGVNYVYSINFLTIFEDKYFANQKIKKLYNYFSYTVEKEDLDISEYNSWLDLYWYMKPVPTNKDIPKIYMRFFDSNIYYIRLEVYEYLDRIEVAWEIHENTYNLNTTF